MMQRMERITRTLTKVAAGLACLTAFGLGGAALAGALDEDDGARVSGEDAARAGTAAIRAAGGGDLLSVERDDDGPGVWDVDVLRDGREIEVRLDERFQPVGTVPERDADDLPARESGDGDGGDDDERPLSTEQTRRAGDAAVRVAGGGSVDSVERSDDPGEAYEVEVVRDGRELDVALDADFEPVRNARYDD